MSVFVPTQAAETAIAKFNFDTDPGTDYTSISGGNAIAVPVGGTKEPEWRPGFTDSANVAHEGALYLMLPRNLLYKSFCKQL